MNNGNDNNNMMFGSYNAGNKFTNTRFQKKSIQVGESYVLPIEQTKVTASQAKVKKILEETDVKAQEMIDSAENKVQIIIQTANVEATRIIEDAKKKAEQEYEQIKKQAYEEGFKKGEEDGFAKFQTDTKDGLEALETLAKSSFDAKKNIIDSASRDIVELVSVIADKVCHAKFDTKILHQITLDAIKLLNDKENITIIVSPKLIDNIQKMVPEFKNSVQNLQTLKIIEDASLSPDGVIVETLGTRLDSRISSQINEIAQKMLTGDSNGME